MPALIPYTDLFVCILTLYFAIEGWQKGFARTLIGPISFAVTISLSIFLFHQTHNLITTLLVSLLGTVFFQVLAHYLFQPRKSDPYPRIIVSTFSQTSGAILNLAWGLSTLILFFILIVVLPNTAAIDVLKQNIKESYSYAGIEVFIKNKIPAVNDMEKTFEITRNPENYRQILATPQFSSIYHDPAMKDILSDKETRRQIQNKEMGKLMMNPKILAILQNEDFLKKLENLNKELLLKKFQMTTTQTSP